MVVNIYKRVIGKGWLGKHILDEVSGGLLITSAQSYSFYSL